MGTNECSQPASKSSWDSQDFGDVNMVLKWPIFTSPLGLNELIRDLSVWVWPIGIFVSGDVSQGKWILFQYKMIFV